jgi:hypothetical protein
MFYNDICLRKTVPQGKRPVFIFQQPAVAFPVFSTPPPGRRMTSPRPVLTDSHTLSFLQDCDMQTACVAR